MQPEKRKDYDKGRDFKAYNRILESYKKNLFSCRFADTGNGFRQTVRRNEIRNGIYRTKTNDPFYLFIISEH